MPPYRKPQGLRVPYALSVHDSREERRVLAVMREHRTNMGAETHEFERRVARAFGKRYGIMVNSGSSANLLAVEIAKVPKGSEVITPVLTFSTTVAPLVQNELIPAFADVDPETYNINIAHVEQLLTRKTKALMIPLFLGNLPDLPALKAFAKAHKLVFIDDSCDTLGATFAGIPSGRFSGISTTSFFGAHIITAGGNGGMIMVSDPVLRDKAKVLRGWGRSTALSETEDFRARFRARLGNIPYDAKFLFGEIGYNLLPNEMCSAFGNVQMDRLPRFRKIREYNFRHLSEFFRQYEEFFVLPKQHPQARTQWISFPLTIRKSAPFSRLEFMVHLEERNIQTRPVAAGNILRQPGFRSIERRTLKEGYKVADAITERGVVIGVHHGLTKRHLDKMKSVVRDFLKSRAARA